MPQSKNTLQIFTRKLQLALEKLSDEEIELILSGGFEIIPKKAPKKSSVPASLYSASNKQNELITELSNQVTREKAAQILSDKGLSKKELEQVTKILSLPVRKQDNISRLQERIIDSTVGARLNREAIRGDS